MNHHLRREVGTRRLCVRVSDLRDCVQNGLRLSWVGGHGDVNHFHSLDVNDCVNGSFLK